MPVPTFAQVRVLQFYTLTDLSEQALSQAATAVNINPSVYSLAPWYSEAFAINNAGQAVGIIQNLFGFYHGFRTKPNAPIDYLGGDDLSVLTGEARSSAFAVNNSGVAVGESGNYIFGEDGAGFRSTPGLPIEDLKFQNADYTHPTGINDSGWIVGYSQTGGRIHSFLSFGPGQSQIIDSWYGSPLYSQALGVNNRGQLVGQLSDTGNFSTATAFLWNFAGALVRIGTLPGGTWSVGYALNDSGQVVGVSGTPAPSQGVIGAHAFLFRDLNGNGVAEASEITDLYPVDNTGSAALSINKSGIVVGSYYRYDGSTPEHAAIFANGTLTDLNNLVQGGAGGWTLVEARGINDQGQIVGMMRNSSGAMHGFRLDPVPRFRRP
jgi:uncharacterized membrane protein